VVEGEWTVTRGIERHDQRARNGVRAGWTSIMPCNNASLLVVLPASGEWIITHGDGPRAAPQHQDHESCW
jgi:hypothetical protein